MRYRKILPGWPSPGAMAYSVLGMLLFFLLAGIGTGLILGGWVTGEGAMLSWGAVALVVSAAPLLASALGRRS